MQLNLRQGAILTDILCRDIHDLTELTNRAGISGRTLSNDIAAINDAIASFGIICVLHRGEGYVAETQPENRLTYLRKQLRYRSHFAPRRERESDERVGQMIRTLLMADGYMTIDQLADTLFVTRSALNQDLRRLREVLERYDLLLDTKPHHGIAIRGNEPGYRQCMVDFCRPYHHEIEPLSFLPDGYSHLNIRHEEVRRLYHLISALFVKEGISCSQQALERLLITALVVRHRSKRRETTYPLPPELERSIAQSPAFPLTEQILAAPSRVLPRNELCYFAMILLANISFHDSNASKQCGVFYERAVRWQEELEAYYQAHCNLSFRADRQFAPALRSLLIQFAVRRELGLPEWEYEGPAFHLACQLPVSRQLACQTLEQLYRKTGYFGGQYMLISLTMLFYNSIMSVPTDRLKLRILCVSPHDMNAVRSIGYKIRAQHSNYIATLDSCLPWELEGRELAEYDCILTTEPEELLCVPEGIPVIQLDYFMNWRDLYEFRNRVVLPSVSGQRLVYRAALEERPDSKKETKESLITDAFLRLGEEPEVAAFFSRCAEALPLQSGSGQAVACSISTREEGSVLWQVDPALSAKEEPVEQLLLCQLNAAGKLDYLKNADSILRRVLNKQL